MFYVKINKKIKVKLYSLTIEEYYNFQNKIAKILQDNNKFYSITKEQTTNKISLFIEECDEIKELDYDDIYNILSIYSCDNQINNYGIVYSISNVFTKYNIPIIYINTFSENLILINENDFEKAVVSLQQIIDSENIILS